MIQSVHCYKYLLILESIQIGNCLGANIKTNCSYVFLLKLKIPIKFLRWSETAEAASILKASLRTEGIIPLQSVIQVSSVLPLSLSQVDVTVETSLKT
jgi:hypothetical protein